MPRILVESAVGAGVAGGSFELCERKGLGHPDTICDSIAQAISDRLCGLYLESAGRVLHHNIDKALLVAGQSRPAFGGGVLVRPMRFLFGDRATDEVDGRKLPVEEVALEAARDWVRRHLRFVDPSEHLKLESQLQPGSVALQDIFARERLTANDTSAGVGSAPLSETERLVLHAEQWLNDPATKQRLPMIGEDVKVMGRRLEKRLDLTVAIAFVDRFVRDERHYFELKEQICSELHEEIQARSGTLEDVSIEINTLDRPGSVYLTVLGTSADGADGGEVGRGNRANGLIPFLRPVSLEATAGKNPVSHVGRIYNLFATRVAEHVVAEVPGVVEATVTLCSQIGHPLDEPWLAAARLVRAPEASPEQTEVSVREVIERELSAIDRFVQELAETSRNRDGSGRS